MGHLEFTVRPEYSLVFTLREGMELMFKKNFKSLKIALFVIKCKDVFRIQNLLKNFKSNLLFTVDLFQDEVVHFLDFELSPDGISIFRKNTNTGLYTYFSSYVSWTHRTAWIKSFTYCASRICSTNKLSSEINFTKKLAYCNGFPRSVVKTIIYQVLNTTDKSTDNDESP